MKRIISIRELALLAVLIVLAAYYFVVQGPVARETEELASQKVTLENQLTDANIKIASMNKMQSELDAIYAESNGSPQVLSDYSNNRMLLQELNIILNMADEFDVSFGDVSFTDNVMRREITISLTTQTKEAAEFIVNSIESSNNTYLVTGFNTSDNNKSTWSSSISLVNYEFVTDEQAAELGLKDGDTEDTGKTETERLAEELNNGIN